jgi:hypothetical protein
LLFTIIIWYISSHLVAQAFADQEGNAVDGMPEMLITINFVEHEGKTKLITRSQFASIETLQQVMVIALFLVFRYWKLPTSCYNGQQSDRIDQSNQKH